MFPKSGKYGQSDLRHLTHMTAPVTLIIATGHELSLALVRDGEVVRAFHEPLLKGHAEALMPAIAKLLDRDADADAPQQIIVEIGPGSFTGLRVGIAAARALGLAWGVPVRGVRSTLLVAAAARKAWPGRDWPAPALVALAAPRGQIWLEAIALDDLSSMSGPIALSATDAMLHAGQYPVIIGSGAGICGADAMHGNGAPRATNAADIPERHFEAPVALYIRPVNIAEPA